MSGIKRSLSRREKVLLLVLALIGLIGLYFYLVHYPIVNRMAEIENERGEVADQQIVADARSTIYKSMRSELDEIFAMPEDKITVMPEYDNIQVLMQHFNTIFANVNPELSFDSVTVSDGVAVRTVRFTFSASGYDEAKEVIKNLTGTGFRCLLSGLTFSPTDGDLETNGVRVSGVITFYENAAETTPAPGTNTNTSTGAEN